MGKTVRCPECGETYRSLDRLEDLRDNDGICLVCNAPIEVSDWDRVLASYEDDELDDIDDIEDLDDVDGDFADDDWSGEDEDEDEPDEEERFAGFGDDEEDDLDDDEEEH